MKKNLFAQLLYLAWLLALPGHASDDAIANLRQTGKAFASVARAVSPSVVFIQVEGKASRGVTPFFSPFGDEGPFGEDFFKRFFGDQFPGIPRTPRSDKPQEERRVMGQGSGFVFAAKDGLLSNKTYILTNSHVVENADKIRVKFQDDREFVAKVTGRDPQSDIAVIEINAHGYHPLTLADSSKVEVGEWVVAIGNPFGLSHTLTVGVVSAKGRTSLGINDYEDFIQTDAAINPGNSGGPLVNLNGEAVGINTAIFSRSGGYMGVGFAIPSNLAKTIANQLIEHGEVTRGYLGIVIQQLTSALAESFGIEASQGVLVAQVSKHSPAEKAGLRQGDIIERFEGEPVKDVGSLRNRVALTAPGTTVELVILRDGKQKTMEITIGKLTKDKQLAEETSQRAEDIGLTVQTLTPQLAEQFDAIVGEGVLVTEVRRGSIAAMAGIKPGTIVLQVNRKEVKSAAEFQRAVKESSSDKRLLLLIREGETQRFVALSW
ncbi:DegQ family serine endoprotease [Nitrosomonas sp. Nm33]|uniref:DegQ family serine endoprotease n=1 Tax=Nitrosomonas sp. Nm33 TaxID=133724 RepID=UPI00089BFC38|nr:DegQ family serine endoprotease [Nitrosomonas sp. Nm33]SDY53909.1 serine protease Do [Nitrosomonas sp. Nm33]